MSFRKEWARAPLVIGIVGSVFLVPSIARAEGISGADVLIPKPAEFIPALAAFLVIWIIMAKFIWPPVLKAMESRQQKIQDDLDAAEQSKLAGEKICEQYKANIAEAQKQADAIITEAKKDAESLRSQILAKAQEDASATIAKARDAAAAERKKAMVELSESVVDLSVEIAGKIIGGSLSDEQQRRLAEKYLHEVSASHEQQS